MYISHSQFLSLNLFSPICIIAYTCKPSKTNWFHELECLILLSFCCLLGKYYEKVCELCHITLNKVAISGDNGAITPGGVRIGKCGSHYLDSCTSVRDVSAVIIAFNIHRYSCHDIKRLPRVRF